MSNQSAQPTPPTNSDKPDNSNNQWLTGISIIGNITYTLAIPIILFTLAGRYLDQKFNHNFLFILLGGLFGLSLGLAGVYRQAKAIRDKIYPKK
jgi:ATP synthase protein I